MAIKTGFNEAFIVDQATRDRLIAEDPRSAEIIKPLVVGEDIKRYCIDPQDQYIIFTRRGIDITQYPTIERHLRQYKTRLEPKPSNWNDETRGEWVGRKPGPYKWYEIQDNIAYFADFEKPKIMWPVIGASNKFAFDTANRYSNDKTFFIPTDDLYLLAILNSSTAFLFFRSELSALRGGFFEYRAQTLVHTPIRRIAFTTPPEERTYYLEKARKLYEYCLSKNDRVCVTGFVEHHLSKEPEESDVVHDLLAFLAEEMIRLNKEKRDAQKEFLDWLAITVKVLPDKDGRKGIGALTGKSKLAVYAGDYQKGESALELGELWDILLKNKPRLGVRLSEPGLMDEVRGRYEESLGRVLPIKERLERTDRLIDAVVYRLYGLTEDEIKIVEGKA